jgi:hypothetical protein
MTLSRLCALALVAAGCSGGVAVSPPVDPSNAAADLGSVAAADLGSVAAADLAPPYTPDDLATPAPPVKQVLDVLWQGQQTGYWCGPGSTRMALTTRLGDNAPSQQTLADYLGTTVDGTDDISLVRGALNHYLGTSFYEAKYLPDPPSQAQRAELVHDIVYDISRGYPLVANVVSGWRPPGYPSGTIYHYVAVVGYDQSGALVLIADPAGDGAGGASWTGVPRTYWISVEDLGTWIGGKGYTA